MPSLRVRGRICSGHVIIRKSEYLSIGTKFRLARKIRKIEKINNHSRLIMQRFYFKLLVSEVDLTRVIQSNHLLRYVDY